MASTDIQRTFGTPTNAKKFTFSIWVKRCNQGSIDWIMNTAGDFSNINFLANDCLEWGEYTSGVKMKLVTNRKFRDPAAWYHLCFTYDSTLAAAGDRQRMYVNGVEETSFSTDTNPTLNLDSLINSAILHSIGSQKAEGYANYGNILLSHVHFIDGTAYPASSFGSFDSTSGIWKINTGPSVTYGDNGFFIFKNDAGITDQSGEGNNWTASNGTLTATKDSPSNNFCTLNPLDNYYPAMTFTNGDNTITTTGSKAYATGTFGLSAGLWYWEVKPTAQAGGNFSFIGIADVPATGTTTNFALGYTSTTWCYYSGDGKYRNSDTSTTYGDSYTTDDIVGVYLDLTANKLYFAKNGVIQNSGTGISITAPASTANGQYFPGTNYWDAGVATYQHNFGNGYFGTDLISSPQDDEGGIGAFKYDPSTGTFDSSSKDFRAITTKNIKAYGG